MMPTSKAEIKLVYRWGNGLQGQTAQKGGRGKGPPHIPVTEVPPRITFPKHPQAWPLTPSSSLNRTQDKHPGNTQCLFFLLRFPSGCKGSVFSPQWEALEGKKSSLHFMLSRITPHTPQGDAGPVLRHLLSRNRRGSWLWPRLPHCSCVRKSIPGHC